MYRFNMFTFSMNVILVSSSISSSLLLLFKSTIEVNSFCENSQYEIFEKLPIYDHFIKKIKSEIVPEQTIEIINKMAVISSQIEEGHVLCFLASQESCCHAAKPRWRNRNQKESRLSEISFEAQRITGSFLWQTSWRIGIQWKIEGSWFKAWISVLFAFVLFWTLWWFTSSSCERRDSSWSQEDQQARLFNLSFRAVDQWQAFRCRWLRACKRECIWLLDFVEDNQRHKRIEGDDAPQKGETWQVNERFIRSNSISTSSCWRALVLILKNWRICLISQLKVVWKQR